MKSWLSWTLLLALLLAGAGCHRTTITEIQPLRTAGGFEGDIEELRFSPNGKQLAGACSDKTIRIWDASTGSPLQTLTGHSAVVASVAFSPDGKQMVSGSWDKHLRIWDLATGKCLHDWQAHIPGVLAVDWSHNGKWIASGGSDHAIRIWDANTCRLLHTMEGGENPLVFSPDSQRLASSSEDHALKIWLTKDWSKESELVGHDEAVVSIDYSLDGQSVATGSADTNAILWNIPAAQQSHLLRLQLGWVYAVHFLPDTKVVMAGAGKVMQFYDVRSGAYITTLPCKVGTITSAVIAPDGKTIAVAGRDNKIAFYQTPSL